MYEQEFEDITIPVYYTFNSNGIVFDEEAMRELFEEELKRVKRELFEEELKRIKREINKCKASSFLLKHKAKKNEQKNKQIK